MARAFDFILGVTTGLGIGIFLDLTVQLFFESIVRSVTHALF